jgi:hypothetical protein
MKIKLKNIKIKHVNHHILSNLIHQIHNHLMLVLENRNNILKYKIIKIQIKITKIIISV